MVAARLVAEKQADARGFSGKFRSDDGGRPLAYAPPAARLRPAITTFLPTLSGFCVLTDAGANVDCKPKHLLQFAIMGQQVMKSVFGRANPKVGILSIGEEPTKGTS